MLSIVIPVFNEEQNLVELNRRLLVVCNSLDTLFEIIYVDDGSLDNGLDLIKGFCEENGIIHFISFYRNFGQHAAVIAGFSQAKGNVILTLDADLQNPPEEIPKFVEKMKEGFDIVAGKRLLRKDSILRKMPSYLMNKIIALLTGVKLNDYGCMMRAYRSDVINNLVKYGEKSVYIPAFTSWLTKNCVEIPIKHDKRHLGHTKYSLLKLLRQAFDLITAYTIIPIQVVSIIGLWFFFLGLFLFMYLMYYRIFIGTPNSLTSFIAALIFFSGMIMFSLGLISEYISRLFQEVRKMPLYIIREKT